MTSKNNNRFIISIPKEELSSLPAAEYDGGLIVIDSLNDVEEAVNILRESDVIGFDTETRPSFRKGQSHSVALMQLATRSQCFLFRINKIGFPDHLKNLLEDETVLKVGLSIHDDFHNLNKISTLIPRGFVDLQNFVKEYRIADNSLTKIFGIIFGKRISKGQRLTNWEADSLTPNQQAYAALDALACVKIYDELKNGLFVPQESKYYHEEPPHEQSERQ